MKILLIFVYFNNKNKENEDSDNLKEEMVEKENVKNRTHNEIFIEEEATILRIWTKLAA